MSLGVYTLEKSGVKFDTLKLNIEIGQLNYNYSQPPIFYHLYYFSYSIYLYCSNFVASFSIYLFSPNIVTDFYHEQ